MTTRGTENYVFFTDKKLGCGSTGVVFFGRHKRKGEPCACKLFVQQGNETRSLVKENELTYMRQLQHRNIVQCLAIEEDMRTKETVLVMELCSEGSLQKILGELENVYGLAEEAFVDFFKQFVEGLNYLVLHGIAHRDMKPGNILCSKSEDGRLIYKLTDFGATRELVANSSTSDLYGTEEYLHPEIYRRVLIDKVAVGSDLQSNAEIWSIGVTIYQLATGQLPFQAFGGRNNRLAMYEIISKKSKGVISGIQSTRDGPVTWFDELPVMCSLSRNYQDKLVEAISNSLESDPNLQWKFDQFFPFCKAIAENHVVVFFSAVSNSFCRIYVNGNSRLVAVQNELARYTQIDVENQLLFYGSKQFRDIVTAETFVENFPHTSEECPIVLLSKVAEDWLRIEFCSPTLPSNPINDDSSNLSTDAAWSREIGAACYRGEQIASVCVNCQLILNTCKTDLTNCILSRLINAKDVFVYLKTLTEVVFLNMNLITEKCYQLEKFTEARIDTNSGQFTLLLRSVDLLLKVFIKHIKKQESLRETLIETMTELETSLGQLQQNMLEQPLRHQVVPVCKDKRCVEKNRHRFKQSMEIFIEFSKDKSRQLSYNEEQMHKYSRIKLGRLFDESIGYTRGHCVPATQQKHRTFRDWFCDWFVKQDKELHKIENLQVKMGQKAKEHTEEAANIAKELGALRKQFDEQSCNHHLSKSATVETVVQTSSSTASRSTKLTPARDMDASTSRYVEQTKLPVHCVEGARKLVTESSGGTISQLETNLLLEISNVLRSTRLKTSEIVAILKQDIETG